MKALVGAFNQEKALVGAFSVIVQPVVESMDRFTATVMMQRAGKGAPAIAEQVSLLIGSSPVSMLTRVKSPKSDFQVGKSCSSLSKLKLKVCYELIMTFGIQISAGRAGAGEASPAI